MELVQHEVSLLLVLLFLGEVLRWKFVLRLFVVLLIFLAFAVQNAFYS